MAIAGAEPRPPRRPAPARNRRAHRRPRHQPATAAMRGYAVREVAVAADGDVDIEALKAAVGPPRLASCSPIPPLAACSSRHLRLQSKRLEAATIPPQGVEPSQNRQFRPRVPWCAARQETVVFGSWQGCYRLKIQVNGRAEGRSHFGLRSAAHGDIQVNANGLPRGPAPVRLALQLELIHAAVHPPTCASGYLHSRASSASVCSH